MTLGHGPGEIREGDVVAAALPAGDELVSLVRVCWESGAAVLPLDPAMSAAARERLLAIAAPTVLVDENGTTRSDGIAAQDGDALLIATSGTTGEPRVVVLSRDAIDAAVRASAARLALDGSEPWLLCIPSWHIGGMLVVMRHVVLGAPLRVHDKADSLQSALSDGATRCASLVPTQLHRLVDTGARGGALAAVLVGGDALDAELRRAAHAAAFPVVHTYGQSQSCGGVVYDGVPLDGVDVAIGDGDEVLLGGPTLMRGYRGHDDADTAAATAAAFDAAGWLRTGDTGSLDAAGRLLVSGRLDDVIITGSEKVAPGVVEAALRVLPGIADAAVVGEPDAEWGSRVVAAVVPRPGALPALDDVRAALRGVLPAYALPAAIAVVESLPRTESGKLRRVEVREMLRSGRGAAQPAPAPPA